MMDHLFMIRAQRGQLVDRCTPGTLERMTPNSPRYSTGASGFGSHMSMCDGPPRIQRMMTDGRRLDGALARASCLSNSANDSPAEPRMPALTKLRRLVRTARCMSAQPRTLVLETIESPLRARILSQFYAI